MVVKMNGKPILVSEEEKERWYEGIDWVHLGMGTAAYSLVFWVLDYAAYLFVGTHPFPFIKFVGVILSWFGIS